MSSSTSRYSEPGQGLQAPHISPRAAKKNVSIPGTEGVANALVLEAFRGTYALHKTELLYRNLAKSLKLAPFWCSYPLRQSPTGEVEKMIWSPTYRLNYQLVKRGRREFFRICTRRKIAKLCVWYQAVNFVDILCFPTPLQGWSRCFQLPRFS